MKNFLVTVLAVFGTIAVLACAAAGVFLYHRFSPSKKLADPADWFAVSGDEVAIVLDNELTGVKARYVGGQVYLPLTWVSAELNERFYWDETDGRLVYTLPEQIVYADTSTMSGSGSPLLLCEDEEVWLLAELVLAYTDIRVESYTEDAVKRVFIDTEWDAVPMPMLKKTAKVRVLGGIKSDILTEVAESGAVQVLDEMEKWSRVRTEDGYIGYVQNKVLGEKKMCSQISTFEAPVYTNISMEEPVCLVWHQVTNESANARMKELMANTKGVNVIAPTWFMLTDNSGSYDCLADASYVQDAHAMGLSVWAVVDNFNRGDNVKSETLFANGQARKKLIAGLIEDVKHYGIDGINLDIEGIKPAAGPHYVQFIRELSVSCRLNGIVLSVDTYVPSAYTSFYNRAEQGRVADYVVIMGYDEHYAGGEAGSVASLGYERKGIEDTLRVVPAEKVISAIPFYTRVWDVAGGSTTSTAMGIASAKQWVADNGVELTWLEDVGQYYGELEYENGTYYLWMEEERSIGLKMELVRENGLAGVACWKLGFEPAEIWDVVNP